MAFKELGGGNTGAIVKWNTPGQIIEGRLVLVKNGKKFANNPEPSKLAVIAQADGTQVTVPLTAVLAARVVENNVQPGTLLRITYRGTAKGKGGVEYKDFLFEADDSGAPVDNRTASDAQLFGASNKPAPASEYDQLALRLVGKEGQAVAGPMLAALEQIFKDPAERLEQLKKAVAQRGA